MSQSTPTFDSMIIPNEQLSDVEKILKEMARHNVTLVSAEAATSLETEAREMGLLEKQRFDNFFNTFVQTSRNEFQSQYDDMKENLDVKALKKKKLIKKQCKKMARPFNILVQDESQRLSTRLMALFRKIIGRKFKILHEFIKMHGEEIRRLQALDSQKERTILLLQRQVQELQAAKKEENGRIKKIEEELEVQKQLVLNLVRLTFPKNFDAQPQPKEDEMIIGIFSDTFFMN